AADTSLDCRLHLEKGANASRAPALGGQDIRASGSDRRVVRQVRREPPFGLGDLDSFPRRVILDLVAGDAADREVAGVRVLQVDAAHPRRRQRRQAPTQLQLHLLGAQPLAEPRRPGATAVRVISWYL